jgi:hypothetical protein
MHRNAAIAGTILLAFSSVLVTSEGQQHDPAGTSMGAGISMGAELCAAEAAYPCEFTPPIITMRGRAFAAVDQ